tara:strand:+ start:66 stop:491 length:426 start_codon:yes stop_codon:yes gene_type:complete
MSASRRLAKLKRSSIVNDVGNSSRNVIRPTNNVVVGNVTQQNSNKRQKVDPMTVLSWHEQRLDTVEDSIKEMGNTINPQLIVSLVETIEEMEKKLTLLTDAYNTLIDDRTKEEVKNEVKNEVSKKINLEGNTVKLNISEKN